MSPRLRRLRRTAWALGLGTALVAVCAAAFSIALRPKQYRPDEQTADLTSSLSSGLPPDTPRPRFKDATSAAGLSEFRTFIGSRTSQLPEDMGPGVAFGDFNNDGFDDVFLVSAGGPLGASDAQLAPCALYRNTGKGAFQRVTAFPELRIRGMAAAWADYDGDGFLDLAVSGYDFLQLFHNEQGTGRFTSDSRLNAGRGFWAGVSWGDYDNDRWPDLYVCGYVQYVANDSDRGRISQQIGTAVPYTLNPASFKPGTNLLFHNRGGTFEEVGATLNVRNPAGRSLVGLWHDFDDDGWQDLYVANDVSDNIYYHNERGRFRDISHVAWVADYRSAMGLAVGDFDRDGDDDLFITHWVAQENALYENLLTTMRTAPRGSNTPPIRFTDIADSKGLGQIALPYVGWGTEFADFDGDGWLDLVAANGSTIEVQGSSPPVMQPQEMFLFWNRRGAGFHNLSPLSPELALKRVSRGLALSDFDNDGDLDILVSDHGEGVRLLRNDMQAGNWLKLRLRSRGATGKLNGFAHGAKVQVRVGGALLRRSVGSASYCSQSSSLLHFGLGADTVVPEVEVRWPAGGTNLFTNMAANGTWEIAEEDPVPRRIGGGTPEISAVPSREKIVEFWQTQRAAMNAMKMERNLAKAIELFRKALAIDPAHEDSRYYLGHCLAATGDLDGALSELAELTRINPQSHRGHQQWGTLRVRFASSPEHLSAAQRALERAHALNPEETGALMVLGEVSLLAGDLSRAEERFAAVCRTNPRAVGAFFLRAYLAAWSGNMGEARLLLSKARDARGPGWQPKGSTSEGDVQSKQHLEVTPLTKYWEEWDGTADPAPAFRSLQAHLARSFPNAPLPEAK